MKGAVENSLTVSRLARTAKVGIPTLRFYDRSGLLPRPKRSASNYRLYPRESVHRIRFIRRAQQLGFSLSEIKELLNLRRSRQIPCALVRERAEVKIADIPERIRSLKRMGHALAKLAAACNRQHSEKSCPILEYLEDPL